MLFIAACACLSFSVKFKWTEKLRYQDLEWEIILNSSSACIFLEMKRLIWYKIYMNY